VGRYDANPRSNFAETAIVVGERWRKRGIGRYLLERLIEYARSRGIAGITSEILAGNQGMVRLHDALGHTIRWDAQDKIYVIRHAFEPDSAKQSTAVHAGLP
jgi:GNAT superfamily N-acetyltransferase